MSFTKRTRTNVYRLAPTGDAETDTTNLTRIYQALPSSGGQVVVLDNALPLVLDSQFAGGIGADKPWFIRGETRNAVIEKRGTYVLNWGGYESAPAAVVNTAAAPTNNSLGVFEFSGLARHESKFQSPLVSLAKGDWVCLIADDPTSGQDPHGGIGTENRPMEVHRVAYVSGSDVVLSSPVREAMTINPRLQKLSMIPNCGLADLTLRSNIQTAGSSTRTATLNIDKTLGFRIENVITDESGFGDLVIDRSADVVFNNFSGYSQPNPHIDYGVVAVTVNGFSWNDSYWKECRHVFTTSGTGVAAGHRYGGIRGAKLNNIVASCGGDVYGNSYIVFDCHAEGSDIEFNGCEVHAASQQIMYGFSTRARATRFNNCKFFGGKNSSTSGLQNTYIAFLLGSEGNEINDCRIEDTWIGISASGSNWGKNSVTKSKFIRAASTAIYSPSSGADEWSVIGSEFEGCGTYDNAGTPLIPKTIMEITGGTGHVIRDNRMDKGSNDYAFHFDNLLPTDLELRGNYVRGYGSGKMGVRGDTGDPNSYSNTSGASINTEFAAENYVTA